MMCNLPGQTNTAKAWSVNSTRKLSKVCWGGGGAWKNKIEKETLQVFLELVNSWPLSIYNHANGNGFRAHPCRASCSIVGWISLVLFRNGTRNSTSALTFNHCLTGSGSIYLQGSTESYRQVSWVNLVTQHWQWQGQQGWCWLKTYCVLLLDL